MSQTMSLGGEQSLVLRLPADTERRVRERAEQVGRPVNDYVCELIERDLTGANRQKVIADINQVLEPLRRDFDESGMTDEELDAFLQAEIDAYRREKRQAKGESQ